jgi:hypothetical protein
MVLSLVTVSTIDIQGFHGREYLRLAKGHFYSSLYGDLAANVSPLVFA